MASTHYSEIPHEPIHDLKDYNRVVNRTMREAAGLPLYDMDDPERPFTPEYDESLRTPTPIGVSGVDNVEEPSAEDTLPGQPASTESLVARVDKMAAVARQAGEKATATALDDREDAYESLGGGLRTLRREGFIPPVGDREDITQSTAHGKGGRLVTRLKLGHRFIDVPLDENLPHAPELEAAKDRLLEGKGTLVRRLPKNAR